MMTDEPTLPACPGRRPAEQGAGRCSEHSVERAQQLRAAVDAAYEHGVSAYVLAPIPEILEAAQGTVEAALDAYYQHGLRQGRVEALRELRRRKSETGSDFDMEWLQSHIAEAERAVSE